APRAIMLSVCLVAALLMLALLAILLMLALFEAAAGVALLAAIQLGPLLLLTVFRGAVAPALIAARDKPAHRLDHTKIMVGVLPIGLGRDPIARGGRFAGQRLVLVEDLVGVAAHTHVGTAAIENLVS